MRWGKREGGREGESKLQLNKQKHLSGAKKSKC